ncbi:DarT ssDNA thymidine ADP-ribosyltransferase family protein, partial [Escherichia sp. TWPC-MK]
MYAVFQSGGKQHRRSEMRVTCGPGGVVHDYVPFYFTKRSPMLLKVFAEEFEKTTDLSSIASIGIARYI